jgi:hypothetical protein
MAKVHGGSGSLTDLLVFVGDRSITTLSDIVAFTKNFETDKARVMTEARLAVQEKIEDEKSKLAGLHNAAAALEARHAAASWFGKLLIKAELSAANRRVDNLKSEIAYMEQNPELLARQHAAQPMDRLDRIWRVLKEQKFLIYGAMGEEKTIAELSKLPDGYVVINDFRKYFHPPIYNRKEDDRVYSIQIDHIVVGPTGLFIIETKNWSKHSIESADLFSPVKQVKRYGFALFVYLNDAINRHALKGLESNWGQKKISPKQIVVSINPVPHTDFQFVRVLNISNLNQFITAGAPEFSPPEVAAISEFLLNGSESREWASREKQRANLPVPRKRKQIEGPKWRNRPRSFERDLKDEIPF